MTNINDLQEQFENFIKQGQELLEKMKENQNADVSKRVRWMPKFGEKYFYITPDFKLKAEYFEEQFDKECWSAGNCFETEEEAQKELDRRLAERELLDLVDAKMSDDGYKFYIEYDPRGEVFYPNQTVYRFATPILFSSAEYCREVICMLGEEKLKLIFRID